MAEVAEIAGLSFEQALAELEQIVAKLESGQAPLEQSIEMYERGAALKAHCETRLEAARLRVEKVVTGNSEGVIRIRALAPGRYEFFDDFHPETRGVLVAK